MIDAVAIIKSALANQQDPYVELAKAMFNRPKSSAEKLSRSIGTTCIQEP